MSRKVEEKKTGVYKNLLTGVYLIYQGNICLNC